MAQSEKVFRDTLCESRSYGVETADPTGARTIDELRRQVKELRAQVEGEKVKFRQAQREHEKKLQQIRDEEAMRLDAALEACSVRKEQEKLNELKKLEERLGKLREQDLRMLRKEKMEELNRSLRKWQLEKNEAVRLAAEIERRKSSEEFQAQYSEEEAQSREAKLTREVFILGEQNEALEEQVRNLSKLNRAQIDQMRRLKMESDMKVENVIKQHKLEASREMAQLKLAEQIIADKDHHLQHSEYRADVVQMEKEALQEELAAMKSMHNTSLSSSIHDTSLHETGGTPTRKTGMLQRRLEELEKVIKKLEEEKGTLKQDNAALRKRLLQEDGDKKGGGGEPKSAMEDKVKMLRKKNSELSALTKQLDDKYKALKAEHDQLQKSRGNTGDGDNVRKHLARQHAKDISEYTKQIMAKDKELSVLKKKLGKLEVAAVTRSEPAPELEKKLKLMALDKLQMEKVMAKLYSRLPDVVDTEHLSHKDLTVESKKMDEVVSENESLRGEVQALQLQVATLQKPATNSSGMSEKEASSRIEELKKENGRLTAENQRLTKLSLVSSQLEVKVRDLQETVDQLEEDKSKLEQTSHRLRQELEISTMAVKELQSSQDSAGELENEVERLKDELRLKEERLMVIKQEMAETANQVTGQQVIITTLQNKVEDAEQDLRERDRRCADLQASLDKTREDLEALSHTASLHSMGTQVDFIDSKDMLRSRSTSLPSASSMNDHDTPANTSMQQVTKSVPIATEAEATVATPTSTVAPAMSARSGGSGSLRRIPSKDRIRSPKRRSLRSLSPRTSSGDLHDSSLDHEMRAAGFDFTESGDSSDGVGFSDPNLDAMGLESDPSLDRSLTEKAQEARRAPLPTVAWEEKTGSKESVGEGKTRTFDEKGGTDQAQATLDSNVEGGVTNGQGESAGQAQLNRLLASDDYQLPEDTEDTMNESSHLSYSSDGELLTSMEAKGSHEAVESEGSPASEGDKVGIYIAKYTYVPSEMSPNENYDLELPLTAGDYLYVYGEMDSDGFYHGQLLSGRSGMVPSNFIDRVMDEEESQKPPKATSAQLQDIEEVDEEISSGSGRGIPPPCSLTLDRQFVEGDQYSVAIKWEAPNPLPEGVIGYNIYVNEEFNYDVVGADQTSVLLTGIPRKQLVKISVRTVTEEGESANPQKLIILNPQYPESPTNVLVSRSSSPNCLLVQWTPSQPLKEGNPISGYVVCLNKHMCVEVGGNSTPAKTVCAQVFSGDIKEIKQKLLNDKNILLTVQARSSDYLSSPSVPVMISREDLVHVCDEGTVGMDEMGRTSSEASLSSLEEEDEEKVSFSSGGRMNGKKREDSHTNGVEIITVETNGLEDDDEETHNGYDDAARFYRALACYDPHLQSPNKDLADEELGFLEDDIIIGLSEVDEDGFLMGQLDGKKGYVPSNLVEEVTDDDELAQLRTALREKGTLRQEFDDDLQHRDVNGSGLLTDGEGGERAVRTLVAEYDYNPTQDSPNDNAEEELALTEGQLVTVYGWADEDGFVKAEIGGKKGLVPGNYLKELAAPPNNNEVEVFAANEEDMMQADAFIRSKTQSEKLLNQKSDEGMGSSKKKGSVLSRGKNLFTRGKKGGQ